MSRFKVVQIVEDMKVGGQEAIIASLARGLDPETFDVRVWCTQAGGRLADELQSEGYDVQVLGLVGLRRLQDVVRLTKQLRDEEIDVVHTHAWGGGLIGRFAALNSRSPVVVGHVHGIYNYISKVHLLLDAALCRASTVTICCSRAARDFVVEQQCVPAEKVTVIYNGIDLSPFHERPAEEKAAVRQELGVETDGPVVGSVGHLLTHKGHEHLVRAFPQVLKAMPRARLLLVGEGKKRDELAQLAEDLGVAESTIFTGVRRDVPKLLSIMDVFVLPSLNEGLGMATIEAMASRVPVVASRVGGIPEIVRDRETGLLVEPGSPEQLAEAILEILVYPEWGEKLCEAGRDLCRQDFNVEGMVGKVSMLYQGALARAGR